MTDTTRTQLYTAVYFCFIDGIMVSQWVYYSQKNKNRVAGKNDGDRAYVLNSVLLPVMMFAVPAMVGATVMTSWSLADTEAQGGGLHHGTGRTLQSTQHIVIARVSCAHSPTTTATTSTHAQVLAIPSPSYLCRKSRFLHQRLTSYTAQVTDQRRHYCCPSTSLSFFFPFLLSFYVLFCFLSLSTDTQRAHWLHLRMHFGSSVLLFADSPDCHELQAQGSYLSQSVLSCTAREHAHTRTRLFPDHS